MSTPQEAPLFPNEQIFNLALAVRQAAKFSEAYQLILDSEARAIAVKPEVIAYPILQAERDQLRAELAPLRELVGVDSRAASGLNDIAHWKKLMDAWDDNVRLRAEVERLTTNCTQLQESYRYHEARAERAEAELAALKKSVDDSYVQFPVRMTREAYTADAKTRDDLRVEVARLTPELLSSQQLHDKCREACDGLRAELAKERARLAQAKKSLGVIERKAGEDYDERDPLQDVGTIAAQALFAIAESK